MWYNILYIKLDWRPAMKVLNFEDSVFKHSSIAKVLKSIGIVDITWVKNIEDGLDEIEDAMEPFDLIISDMHYPVTSRGESDFSAGEKLIDILREKNIDIPVIICSSMRIYIPGMYGTVWYDERSEWREELKKLITELQSS